MTSASLVCQQDRRREAVRQSALLGLDFVEVSADQTILEVFFLGKAPAQLVKANVTLTGGRTVRVTTIAVHREPDPSFDDWLEVHVDVPGDFSTYTLGLVKLDAQGRPTSTPMDGFDPRFAAVTFSFKASCPSDLDCCAPHVCPPPARVPPDINYLAKDFASFQQLILDRLAQTMPSWQETHVPDIGVMLVELLAYVGDQLSYFQDAVATEAYLGTARRRISVRRHARLVDYTMHEGCNARAWLTLATTAVSTTLDPTNIFFCTALPGVPVGPVLQMGDFAKAAPGSSEVFEPLQAVPQTITLRAAHNEISFYTWGDWACCLPTGTTTATLTDAWLPSDGPRERALDLKVNDVLIFEEVIGPGTGNSADADQAHRQAVCLTSVEQAVDPLYDRENGGVPIVNITWCSQDALTFPLCISAIMPAPNCTCLDKISVARGNVILVDNGLTVLSEALGTVPTQTSVPTCPTDCRPATVVTTAGPFAPVLQQEPLTFGQDLPACGCASTVITQDPRQALPRITLTGTVATPQRPVKNTWSSVPDLLESGPNDLDFVVEIDNHGSAHLRFGSSGLGAAPAAGTVFSAQYRVGNGVAGNVGADTITYLVLKSPDAGSAGVTPRNPLAAGGGTAPESLADVRMLAPYTFRDVLERAITADDYATLAADNARRLAARSTLLAQAAAVTIPMLPVADKVDDPRAGYEEEPGAPAGLPADLCLIPFTPLQNAKGTLCWNGSWYEAVVAVEPLGTDAVSAELLAEIGAYLEPYRRIGHDLDVDGADYVALDVGLSICVMASYLRGRVEAALLGVLGNGLLADGTPGLFNPVNFTFGESVYVSRIVAAAQAIAGVIEVQVTRLARYVLGAPAPGAKPDSVPPSGVLTLGSYEVARLDNDPNAPANGRLTLLLRGGR